MKREYDLKMDMERIKNGTYILEYQLLGNDDYDAFEEFSSLTGLKQFLADRTEIKKYRIFDCYRNEVVLES